MKQVHGAALVLDPDAEMLARYVAGDPAVATQLIERLSPRVFALAQRTLGDPSEAEDVVQEAMLRLWKIAPEWDSNRAKVSTWLYRVTLNLCTDRLRKRKPTDPLENGNELPSGTAPVQDLLQQHTRVQALRDAMGGLPVRQRQAVTLRDLQELSNPEAAEIMETSVEALESLLSRGRRRLREVLGDRREELGFTDD